MQWYAPGGMVDTRGIQFHAFNITRLVFLLPLQAGLSLAVVLLLFSWYFGQREDADPAFLAWVAQRGRSLGMFLSPFYALFGLLWAFTEGQEFGLTLPIGGVLGLLGVALFLYFRRLETPACKAPQAFGIWLIVLLLVASVRELIRCVSLVRFGYSIYRYPYTMDWGSILVFGGTTLVGVTVIAYLIMVLYQSGATKDGGRVSPGIERLGRVATGMLGVWFACFLLLGVYTSLFLK